MWLPLPVHTPEKFFRLGSRGREACRATECLGVTGSRGPGKDSVFGGQKDSRGDNNIAGGPGVAGDGDNNISWDPGVAGGGDNNISWGPGVASTRERRGTGPGVWGRRGDKKIAGGPGVPGSQREYVSELFGNRGSIL